MRSVTSAFLVCTFSAVIFAQSHEPVIVKFDAAGSGKKSGQGTYANRINRDGKITGFYLDGRGVRHGFVRTPKGHIERFNVPGAGTSSNEGTTPECINETGTIAGYSMDSNERYHAFVRSPSGTITQFDAPSAGAGSMQGTVVLSVNTKGTAAGFYVDTNNVFHGFLRGADGTLTQFDAPGADLSPNHGTRAFHPINFDIYRRPELAPGQIPHRSFTDVISIGELATAPRALQLPVAAFAPHPQLQNLVLLVNALAIYPITRPLKYPGELVVVRQP